MPDYVLKISTPADLSGATATVTSLEKIEQTAGNVTAAGTGAAGAMDRLAQAAAHTPNASLESLAASAQKAAGNIQNASNATGRFVDQAGRLREAGGQFVSLGNAAKETEGILSGMNFGFGIGFGEKAIGGLEEIGHHVTEMFEHGVEGLAEMQTKAIGLGVSLRALEPEKYVNFDAATAAGADQLETLRAKCNALGLDFKALSETLGVALPTLVEEGVTKTSEQFDVLIRLSQLAQKNNLTGAQGIKEVLDELTGRSERTILGKELDPLGLTPKALADAKEAGTTAQLILEKTAALTEASKSLADGWQGSSQTIRNELEKIEQEAAKPIFDKLLALMQGGKATLGTSEATGAARGIGNVLEGTIQGFENIATGIEGFWERHPALKKLNETMNGLTGEGRIFGGVKENIDAGQADSEVDAQIKLVQGLRDKIANAKDDNAVAEARKDLEVAIGAASERTAQAQGDARDRAQGLLLALQDIERHFQGNVGKAPVDTAAADRRNRESDQAQAAYENSPRAAAAHAGGSGDAFGEAEAKAAERAEAIAKRIQAAYPKMTPQQALDDAKAEVAAQARTKETEKLDRVLEGVDNKLEKAQSSTELAAAAAAKFSEIMAGLPEGRRGIAGTMDDHPGLTMAIRSLPNDTEEERKKREDLGKLTVELTRIQNEYNAAKDREGRDQKDTEDAAKRHADVVAAEKESTAILTAQANGQTALVEKLEKERDLRNEIKKLMEAGASYAEAEAVATANINAQYAVRDQKEQAREARPQHRAEPEEHHRRGERETFTIHGYSDGGDRGGGLHTGSLSTGGLSTGTLDGGASSDRFGGRPDAAAAALAKHTGDPDHDPAARLAKLSGDPDHDPMARLAKAPAYVPSFKTLEESAKSLGVWRGGPGDMFPAPTASSVLAPAISTLAPPVPGAAGAMPAPTGSGPADAAQSAYGAGQSALSAAKAALSGAGGGGGNGQANQLKALEGKFKQLESEFNQVKTQVENLKGQNENRS